MRKQTRDSNCTGWLLLLLFVQTMQACSDNGRPPNKASANEKQPETATQAYKKPPSNFSDTLIIDAKSAVFFNPDSLQWEKIHATTSKEMYETYVHNCFYQMRNARMVIKQYYPKVHIIESSRARYLLFNRKDRNKVFVDLDTQRDICGIYLFDGIKDPELIDMMNIDTALRFYFK